MIRWLRQLFCQHDFRQAVISSNRVVHKICRKCGAKERLK